MTSINSEKDKTEKDKTGYEIVFSSGGAASVLAGAGAYAACQLAGIRKFRRIGGVSGGAILGSVIAAGITAREGLHLAVETEFGEHVNFKHGIYKSVRRKLREARRVLKKTPAVKEFYGDRDYAEWPSTGLLGTCGLGRYITALHEAKDSFGWPDGFWTLATTKDGSQVVFNKDGAFLIKTDGVLTQLADTPPPLDIAVRFSATIPGILAALDYKGMMLFDGGLSRDGLCPVGVQIRHFGADPKKIIACRVGEDSLSPVSGTLHRMARRVWQVHPEFHWGPETAGVIEFRPQIEHVHSLKFQLTRDEKWLAILVSFEACLARLALEGLLESDKLDRAQRLFAEIGYWRDAHPAPASAPQLLSCRVESCFAEHGLW